MRFGFPLRLDARGRLATVDDEEYLRGLVEAVLFTRPGERVNRPDFGSGVDRLVFAPSGDELAGATQSLVQAAVQRWLSDLLRVHEVRVEARDAVLDVTIRYTPLRQDTAEPRVLRLTGRGTP
ncbi:GPW/gp25 family protein [Streptomyces sp. NPDC002623]